MIYFSYAFMLLGLFFFVTATIGLLRFPDIFCRLHATSKSDTLASLMMFVGIAFYIVATSDGFELRTVAKIFLTTLFITISGPVIAHEIGRRAYKNGLKHWVKEEKEKF